MQKNWQGWRFKLEFHQHHVNISARYANYRGTNYLRRSYHKDGPQGEQMIKK